MTISPTTLNHFELNGITPIDIQNHNKFQLLDYDITNPKGLRKYRNIFKAFDAIVETLQNNYWFNGYMQDPNYVEKDQHNIIEKIETLFKDFDFLFNREIEEITSLSLDLVIKDLEMLQTAIDRTMIDRQHYTFVTIAELCKNLSPNLDALKYNLEQFQIATKDDVLKEIHFQNICSIETDEDIKLELFKIINSLKKLNLEETPYNRVLAPRKLLQLLKYLDKMYHNNNQNLIKELRHHLEHMEVFREDE